MRKEKVSVIQLWLVVVVVMQITFVHGVLHNKNSLKCRDLGKQMFQNCSVHRSRCWSKDGRLSCNHSPAA